MIPPVHPRRRASTRADGGFTLVELLAVAAIMVVVMGILAASLSQAQSRGVQMAASQVASAMGVARQTAITRNTDAMFIISPLAGNTPTSIYPPEPYRYWAVVYSNRGSNNWTLATDWSPLPNGTVFAGLVAQGHNTITWSPDGSLPPPGTAFSPRVAPSRLGEWQYFNNFTNFNLAWSGGSADLTAIPFIGFKPGGQGYARNMVGGGTPPRNMAIVLAEGSVVNGNQLSLRSTNNITHVETESRGGRIVVRPRESYR